MRHSSLKQYDLATNDTFDTRVLMLALTHAHEIMNLQEQTDSVARLKAKATDLINQPDQYRERLALSVVSILDDDEVEAGLEDLLEDADITRALLDVFDAMAGVTPLGLS